MSPKEKAEEGLRLLKEAVCEYLAEHPPRVLATDVRDALRLWSADPKDDHKDSLFRGVIYTLMTDREVDLQKIDGRNYLALVHQPEANA